MPEGVGSHPIDSVIPPRIDVYILAHRYECAYADAFPVGSTICLTPHVNDRTTVGMRARYDKALSDKCFDVRGIRSGAESTPCEKTHLRHYVPNTILRIEEPPSRFGVHSVSSSLQNGSGH